MRKAIREAINDKTEPRSIKNLRISAFSIFSVLTVIAIIEFLLVQNQLSTINGFAQLIDDAFLRYAYMMRIGTYTRSLILY